MTTDTTTLDAGRELDAAVAERVMGWAWATSDEDTDAYLLTPKWAEYVRESPAGGPRYGKRGLRLGDDGRPRRPLNQQDVPNYSADLAAAWLVVAEVQRRHPGWRFSLLGGDTSFAVVVGDGGVTVDRARREAFGWHAEFHGHEDPEQNYGQRHGVADADTPALAICRAALAAVAASPA